MTVDGLIAIASIDSYAATVERLDVALSDHAIAPMLRWDHAAAAHEADLALRPLLLVLFGDPRVGSALMQEQATTGIDLPLKLLIWKTASGQVMVGYNDPAWICRRHGLADLPTSSQAMAALLRDLAGTVAGQSGS